MILSPSLLPAHITSKIAPEDALGWLIDGFGNPHAVGPGRTVIGRSPDSQLTILAASVSRSHAELRRVDDGWELRDLGSRNRTTVDGERLTDRVRVGDGAVIRFGDVGFVFVDHPAAMPAERRSIATAHDASQAARYVVRGPGVELCLVAGDGGGVLLHRRGDAAWAEHVVAPLELHLLRVLCRRAVAEASSPSRTRGCVASKELAATLPFATAFGTEENVRKLVQRTRAALLEIDVAGLVETVPGRGYYVAWPVATS
jgi:hypothetical protein